MLVKLTEVSVVVYMISQSIQAPGLVLNYDLLEDSCHVTINNILLFLSCETNRFYVAV